MFPPSITTIIFILGVLSLSKFEFLFHGNHLFVPLNTGLKTTVPFALTKVWLATLIYTCKDVVVVEGQ